MLVDTLEATPMGEPVDMSEGAVTDTPYLLVFAPDSSSIHRLPAQGSTLIGRGESADLQLKDDAVSRAHARISIQESGDTVADLESKNGVSLNGERFVGSRPLMPGDVLTIGPYTLVFHRTLRTTPRKVLTDLPTFCGRLEMEIERALRFDRALSLLAIDLRKSDEAVDKPHIARALEGRTRLIDLAAWDGDARLLVLLPETNVEGANILGQRLLERVREIVPSARAGLAACPADGCDAASLLGSVRTAAAEARDGSAARLSALMTVQVGEREIVVADPVMSRLFGLVRRLAPSDIPVLISGESGAGKEVVATALHAWSTRASAPFVIINCAALPDNLVESELFGYERGAFTGALHSKPGVLETASRGVVFLDEVGELNPSAQAKLLRVIETKRIQRLGAVRDQEVDLRFVSATNRDLEREVREGRFRLDLFHRLSGTRIFVPPIRDRRQDLALLAKAFLDEACTKLGREPMTISTEALRVVMQYRWPGNIRDLRNAMEEVAATASEAILRPEALPARLLERGEPGVVDASKEPLPLPRPAGGPFRNLYDEIADLERIRLSEALQASGGVKNRAAELLGVPLRTFLTKLKSHNITVPREREGPR